MTDDPLKIDEILESVFNACSWKELNVVRLVCKDWHRVSLPIWRKKGPTLALTAKELKVSRFSRCSMNAFLNTESVGNNGADASAAPLHQGGLRQYKHFEISEFGRYGNWELLNTFLTEAGGWITNLHFHETTFHKLDDFKSVMSCKFTPALRTLKLTSIIYKLEASKQHENRMLDLSPATTSSSESEFQSWRNCVRSLDIQLCCRGWTAGESRLPVSWTELLQWYPGLQARAEGRDGFWSEEADKLFNAITKLRRENPNNLELKSLNLVDIQDFEYDPDDWYWPWPPNPLGTFFKNNKFNLETLGLHVTKNNVPLPVFHGLLAQQSTSLKRLLIRGGGEEEEVIMSFENFHIPELSSLESILLFDKTFPNLTFLKQCPNLKSIALEWDTMDYDDPEFNIIRDTADEDMEGVVLGQLREFTCDDQCDHYSAEDLNRLNLWMPNLTALQLRELSAETLRMVIRLWPSLEELTFWPGADVDDEVITGIPVGCETRRLIRLYHNLTDLKELRCLQLADSHCTKLTDKSALFGFLQLPKLTKLAFKAETISVSTLDLLKQKIPDVKVECRFMSAK